jgi:hypothetical protein
MKYLPNRAMGAYRHRGASPEVSDTGSCIQSVMQAGVADDVSTPGLDDDLKLMKQPDLDRCELWLTDYLKRCLGKPAVATVTVTFELVANSQACRIDVEGGRLRSSSTSPAATARPTCMCGWATQPASSLPTKPSSTPGSAGSYEAQVLTRSPRIRNGTGPDPRTVSWNPLMSNRSPMVCLASSRRRMISRRPIM